MSLRRALDGGGPEGPVGRLGGTEELHRVTRNAPVAVGTLACPTCDAPIDLPRPVRTTDPLTCPFCTHTGPARDFISLGKPTRPTRIVVRVIGVH